MALRLVDEYKNHECQKWDNCFPSQMEVKLMILLVSFASWSSMVCSLHSTLSLGWVGSDCKRSWTLSSQTLQNQCKDLNCFMAFNIFEDIDWQSHDLQFSHCINASESTLQFWHSLSEAWSAISSWVLCSSLVAFFVVSYIPGRDFFFPFWCFVNI